MTPLRHVSGTAYPFGRQNVDTDMIISAEWMKTISRGGLGQGAFAALRHDPSNVFDDPRYAGAPILIAGDNFGCGSSREHAVWALKDLGIQAVIAPSFAEIFASNAFKNGILTVVLPPAVTSQLLDVAREQEIRIDLPTQEVTAPGLPGFHFEIDAFRKSCLINGLDEIALTLSRANAIERFEAAMAEKQPWMVPPASSS